MISAGSPVASAGATYGRDSTPKTERAQRAASSGNRPATLNRPALKAKIARRIAHRNQAELRQSRIGIDDDAIVKPQRGRSAQPIDQRPAAGVGSRKVADARDRPETFHTTSADRRKRSQRRDSVASPHRASRWLPPHPRRASRATARKLDSPIAADRRTARAGRRRENSSGATRSITCVNKRRYTSHSRGSNKSPNRSTTTENSARPSSSAIATVQQLEAAILHRAGNNREARYRYFPTSSSSFLRVASGMALRSVISACASADAALAFTRRRALRERLPPPPCTRFRHSASGSR